MKKIFLIATLFLFANIINAQWLKNYVTYGSNVQMIWTLDELQNYFGDYAGYDSTSQTWKYALSLTARSGSTLYRVQYGVDTTNGIINVDYYDIISTTAMTPIKTVSVIPIIYDTQGRASIRVYSATDSPATYCFRQIRIW
jgi:hypothetical protein